MAIENIDFNNFNANLFWRFCPFINFPKISSIILSGVYHKTTEITLSVCLLFYLSVFSLYMFFSPLSCTLCLLLSVSCSLALAVLLLLSGACSLAIDLWLLLSLLLSLCCSLLLSLNCSLFLAISFLPSWGSKCPYIYTFQYELCDSSFRYCDISLHVFFFLLFC